MTEVTVGHGYEAWRDSARALLARDVPPDRVRWIDADAPQRSLFGGAVIADSGASWGGALPRNAPPGGAEPPRDPPDSPALRIPRAFVDLARSAACHADIGRADASYRVLWRLTHGEPRLLEVTVDRDVRALHHLADAVRHDIHRAHAFVRFVRVEDGGVETFVAWHRPDHWIVEEAAPFFARRFGAMRWSILTDKGAAYWDGVTLAFGPPVPASEAPGADALEDLWCAYYGATFNPARARPRTTDRELPRRYRDTMPEARMIPRLLAEAPARVAEMATLRVEGVEAWAADARTLPALAAAAARCAACPLAARATHTVFGEGRADARIVLVGEQPGDEEDLAGRPFVGPAGGVLDDALGAAGLPRAALYLTNAVKHFHWEPRGKRRMHKRAHEVDAEVCRGWLDRELDVVRPAVIVALGATAARAVLGRAVAVTKERGRVQRGPGGAEVVVSWHPSAILRAEAGGAALFADLVADLRLAAERADGGGLGAAATS